MSQPRKAVALISGGLDSMLAAKLMLEQGIHVEGINFYTGFCVEGHTHAIRRRDSDKQKRNNALWVAEQLGIKLHIIDVIEEYKDVLINPKHGYGSLVNPCWDCKGFMVRKAHEWLQENNFDFIVTGEVLGQRPMSQRRATFPVIAEESGAGDKLLRPLCAERLAPTLPERQGWVDRSKLLGITGRSRKPQIQLAAEFGITQYAQPAGGCCFLTDTSYAAKLRDLWHARGSKQYEIDDIMLLKVGRHLRPAANYKLIIGREEGENNYLEGYRYRYTCLRPVSHRGALTLIDGTPSTEDILQAGQLAAHFSHGRTAPQVQMEVCAPNKNTYTIEVVPLRDDTIPKEWYI